MPLSVRSGASAVTECGTAPGIPQRKSVAPELLCCAGMRLLAANASAVLVVAACAAPAGDGAFFDDLPESDRRDPVALRARMRGEGMLADDAADALGFLVLVQTSAAAAVAVLREALEPHEPYPLRLRAARQLFRAGEGGSDAHDALASLAEARLVDAHPDVQFQAAAAFDRIATTRPGRIRAETVDSLETLMRGHPHGDVRVVAGLALSSISVAPAVSRTASPPSLIERANEAEAILRATSRKHMYEPEYAWVQPWLSGERFPDAVRGLHEGATLDLRVAAAERLVTLAEIDAAQEQRAVRELARALDEPALAPRVRDMLEKLGAKQVLPAPVAARLAKAPTVTRRSTRLPREAGMNLSSLFTAEKSFFGEYDLYPSDLHSLQWSPQGVVSPLADKPLLRYVVSKDPKPLEFVYGYCVPYPEDPDGSRWLGGMIPGFDPSRSTSQDPAVAAKATRPHPSIEKLGDVCERLERMGLRYRFAAGGQQFRAFAARDIDGDDDLEVWSIDSSKQIRLEARD